MLSCNSKKKILNYFSESTKTWKCFLGKTFLTNSISNSYLSWSHFVKIFFYDVKSFINFFSNTTKTTKLHFWKACQFEHISTNSIFYIQRPPQKLLISANVCFRSCGLVEMCFRYIWIPLTSQSSSLILKVGG